jgi:hypothetical protein
VRVAGDFVAVVLEETFTPAEKTLIARGGSEGIQFRSIVLRNDLTSRPGLVQAGEEPQARE